MYLVKCFKVLKKSQTKGEKKKESGIHVLQGGYVPPRTHAVISQTEIRGN